MVIEDFNLRPIFSSGNLSFFGRRKKTSKTELPHFFFACGFNHETVP
jgi:hypothetical protein